MEKIDMHMLKRLFLILALMLLASCAVTTDPLTPEERQTFIQENKKILEENARIIDRPMTLDACIARALLANLEYRVHTLETDMARERFDVSKLDMLPSLDFQGNGLHRDPENASKSLSVESREVSLEPSTSQERNRVTGDLTLAWSLLDFGVSYYKARQESNKIHITDEMRRKARQQMVEQVRAAYWRAASAQLFREEVNAILADAKIALKDARKVEELLLLPPLESLNFQRTLLEVVRQLESLQNELEVSQVELLSLMGLPPGSQLTLVVDKKDISAPPAIRTAKEDLINLALDNRPELREGMYKLRISKDEITRSMLETLPGLSLRASYKYDSNIYLEDNLWHEMSLQITGNILDLITAPQRIGLAETKHDMTRMQLLAVHMAVVTQVHVSLRQYERIMRDYEMANEICRVETRISDIVGNQAQANTQSQVENIRSRTVALFSELDKFRSYAQAQNAYGRILVSLGVDILPEHRVEIAAPVLLKHIQCVLEAWEGGDLTGQPCELPTQ